MANMHLVTGYAGQEHVTAADQGAFHTALFGSGQFVLGKGNQLAASVITNNQIRVLDGDILMQGRHIRLNEGEYVDLPIDNGTQGMLRNDLIVARYTRSSSTAVEEVNLVVIKGKEAASNPSDPAYTVGDIIQEHAILHDMPLYRVPLNGLNVQKLVPLFTAWDTTLEDMLALTKKHASRHAKGGGDPLTPADIGAQALLNIGNYFGNIDTIGSSGLPINSVAWLDSSKGTTMMPFSGYGICVTLGANTGIMVQTVYKWAKDGTEKVYHRIYANSQWYDWFQTLTSKTFADFVTPASIGAAPALPVSTFSGDIDSVGADGLQINSVAWVGTKFETKNLPFTGYGFILTLSPYPGKGTLLQIAFRYSTNSNEHVSYWRTYVSGDWTAWKSSEVTPEGIGALRMEVGSYTGTGVYGENNPNSLTFGFTPKIVLIKALAQDTVPTVFMYGSEKTASIDWYGGGGGVLVTTWGEKTLAFYDTSRTWAGGSSSTGIDGTTAKEQLNESGVVYTYMAIG